MYNQDVFIIKYFWYTVALAKTKLTVGDILATSTINNNRFRRDFSNSLERYCRCIFISLYENGQSKNFCEHCASLTVEYFHKESMTNEVLHFKFGQGKR